MLLVNTVWKQICFVDSECFKVMLSKTMFITNTYFFAEKAEITEILLNIVSWIVINYKQMPQVPAVLFDHTFDNKRELLISSLTKHN